MTFDIRNYIEMIFYYKQDDGNFKIGQKDFITFAIITFFLFLVRQIVFAVAGIWKDKVTKKKQLKYQQCVFQAVFRTTCVFVLLITMWKTDDFKRIMTPFMDQEFNQIIKRRVTIPLGYKFVYLLNLSYISIMFPIVYKFENGKGIILMYLHHIVTASVVLSSYMGNLWIHGIPIFFANDAGVFLLYYSKTCVYLVIKPLSTILFFSTFAFYLFFRGVTYPLHVFTAFRAMPIFTTTNQKIQYWVTIMAPLLVLQVMQLVWIKVLSKMAYNIIKYKRFDGDARSDNEIIENKENETNKNKKNSKKNSEDTTLKNKSRKQK
ncbi:ceramide synthase 1 [Anaeramoeba flamelloides]|uniref:Ceramide synthase 1 n=1 Tax=Anaeramoeba flamelloides TaxID=1746091 RepID=A0ABQ8Z5K9_9EUKA|nr:ceramide synthase 1 [Anaeramoeba flamelloides]